MTAETLQTIINALQGTSLLPVFLLAYLLKVYVVNGNIGKYFEKKDKENALLERLDESMEQIIERQERQTDMLLRVLQKGEPHP